jgi:Tol biopolymer transport system component/DNA-binding winged helix-turn-helix (wHTH) protein
MSLIRFADFVADPRTEELKRAGRRVRLPRQSFQILLALARSPGELVTREALQAALWPATSQVEWEQGLNAAVNRLREALGDSAAEPRFIETLPRRGYRFIGRIETDPPPMTPGAPTHGAGTPAAAQPIVRRRRSWVLAMLLGGVVALIAVAVWLVPRPQGPVLRPGQLKPFTALPGEERAPALSPDATRIVFAWNGDTGNGGRYDLYVKTLDSEQLLRLTHAPADWLHPAWSPDGTSIAFARRLAGATGVYLVPSIGGAERRLASAAFVSEAFMQLGWSPDGKTIAYATFDGTGSHVIHLLDVATLADQPLGNAPECWNAGMPAFSRDGRQLAFVCNTSVGVYTVFRMDLAERRAVPIAGFLGEPLGLTWQPDGSSLIVATDAGDGGALWRLAIDGELSQLPFGEEAAAPTRAGTRLAYARARSPVSIWRMDLAAADPAGTAERLIQSTRRDMTPQFSADGRRVVFQSNRSGNAEIWMADGNGANPLRLTQFNGPLSGGPAFCADGRRVALDARVDGNSQLFIVDVDERQPRQVSSTEPALGLPQWSADCQWLLASDGRARLFKLPASGGRAVPFTAQKSYYAQVVGDRVVFNVKHASGVALWSKPLSGGEETALEGLPLIGYTEAWAATRSGVYFTARADGAPTLQFYDFADGRTRRVTSLPKTPVPGGGLGIAVSPDDRWLLYTQSGTAESDIMLMNLQPR